MLGQKIVGWAKGLLKLKQATEENAARLEKHDRAIERLTEAMQALTYQVIRLRDNEEHEREMLALRVENLLLKERGLTLPPKKAMKDEQLLRRIKELEDEAEDLRRKLEDRTNDES